MRAALQKKRFTPTPLALAAALTSQTIKDYINRTYAGAVVPAR